jgi:hypothetical protein
MTGLVNQFTTDEYVLAYHGPLLYEARVSEIPNPTSSRAMSSFGSQQGLQEAYFGNKADDADSGG